MNVRRLYNEETIQRDFDMIDCNLLGTAVLDCQEERNRVYIIIVNMIMI